MQVFNSYNAIPSDARGASAALGNFDGVHIGHRAVIDRARHADMPLAVVSFEPHPRKFFAPDGPPFRLMSSSTKAHRLEKLGVDLLFDLPFNADLASLSAREFVRDVLADGLGLARVVVGADFRFGKGREGGATMLQALGEEFGIEVDIAPLVQAEAEDVSSTAIRTALAAGRPRDAAKMLDHWHRINGIVIKGDERGRDLGFPTANMALVDLHLPRLGIYAVWVDVLSGPHKGAYRGAASIGTRPTFGENIPNLEVFIFDFDGDLYGAELSVALVDYIRPELKFDGIAALISQMQDDCTRIAALLDAE
ncbi:MAG: bifunctional riboflavin kinase/FAD synthetase [Paracoccaceae bacterium]